jgi:hypothetical protein
LQQISSLLLRRKPDNLSAEYFHGAHFSITVPASVPMQLDGSAVKLKDYLKKSEYTTLQQSGEQERVMITYRFDALPHALALAIPRTYNDELFEHTNGQNKAHEAAEHEHVKATVHVQPQKSEGAVAVQEHPAKEEAHPEHAQDDKHEEDPKKDAPALVQGLLENGRKVTVVGNVPLADKQATYIIAGSTLKASTGETRPVAVVVNAKTTIFNRQGDPLPAPAIEELQEGAVIMVEGKKSKRGVIEATRLVRS